jgi:hypothetical protein
MLLHLQQLLLLQLLQRMELQLQLHQLQQWL